jgi:carbonic anhydrase
MQGDLLSNAINENTKDVVAQLESTQPILHEHVKGGNLLVVPARYHLDTGAVELLGNASEAQNTACDFAAMAVLPALQ